MNENRNLIAYCWLYYWDCFNYKDEIVDLARNLRKRLREEEFKVVPEATKEEWNFAQENRRFPRSSRHTKCVESS